MRKKIFAIFFLASLLICPTATLADGMIIPPPNYQVYETGQKAVIWFENGQETLIVSTAFRGDARDFGWIIPVPSKPEVEKGSDEIFTSLQDLTQPKYDVQTPSFGGVGTMELDNVQKSSVTVVETKKVDIYDISVVTSTESEALAEWFKKNDYPYPVSQSYILDEYISNGWYFIAAKIDTAKLGQIIENQLEDGHATPLMINFKTDKIVYPMKISSITGDFYESDVVYQEGFNFTTGGWLTSPGSQTIDQQETYEDQGALKITAGPVKSQTGEISTFYYLPELTKGKTYTYSTYVKEGSKTPGYERTIFLEADQNTLNAISKQIPLPSDWKRLTLTFTAKNSSHRLKVVSYGSNEGDSYYIDAVQAELGNQATDFEKNNPDFEVFPVETESSYNQSVSMEKKIMPYPYPGTQESVDVLLYIFDAKKKTEIPGFSADYAGWVRPKQIEKLAVDSQGNPLLTAKNKMYLTKLSRNMTPSQMTEDLYPRYADNNQTIGQGGSISIEPNKLLLVFSIPLLLEIGFIAWLFNRRSTKQKKEEAK